MESKTNLKESAVETKETKIARLEKRIEELKSDLETARADLADLRGSERVPTVARCELISMHIRNLQAELAELKA
jgi:outer membrane murein-binding lipoprotein Lpp